MFEIYINDCLETVKDLNDYDAVFSSLMNCYIDRDTCFYSYDTNDNIALDEWLNDNDYKYCEDYEAYSNDYIYTEDTNEYYTRDYAIDNLYQCHNCDEWYCNCDSGNYYDDEWYCNYCYNDLNLNDIIYEYHDYDGGYSPRQLKNETPLYLGFELEVDNTNENNNDIARSVLDEDIHNMLHCEKDASVEFEFISQPATLEYHKSMNYNEFLFDNLKGKCQSHDAGTCGLHVHVNRNFFDDERYKRLKTILEFFKEEIFIFSRRQSWNYEYANFGDKIAKKEITIKKSTDKKAYGHSVWFNENNPKTLEFRMFRGTLIFETFIATLELVHNICILASTNTTKISWNDLIVGEYCKDYSLKRKIHCDDILDFDKLLRKEQEREEKELKELKKYDRKIFIERDEMPRLFIAFIKDNLLKMYFLPTEAFYLECLKENDIHFCNFYMSFTHDELPFLKKNYIQLMSLDEFLGRVQ